MKGTAGRRIPQSGTPLADGPITPEDIVKAFTQANVPPPEKAQIERLAQIFSMYKLNFLDAYKQQSLNEVASETGNAIRVLSKNLPLLLAHHSSLAKAGDPFADWQAKAIRDLLLAVETADIPRIEAQSNAPNNIRDWRWLAGVLMPIIKPALPPGTGISKGGPASRFLHEVLPLMCRDKPTAVAIATQIGKIPIEN